MKIKISHVALLDPQQSSQEVGKLTNAILGVADAMVAANIAVYSMLQAQVTSPEDSHLVVNMLKAMGGHLAHKDNVDSPELGELLRTIAKVVHNAGLKMDSVVDVLSDRVVVTTE